MQSTNSTHDAPSRDLLAAAPRRVAGTLLSTGGIQAAGVVSGALVARLLGPDHRGLLAAIILWPSIVAYAGDLGGPAAYSFLSSTQPQRLPALLRNLVGIWTVQSVLLTVLGLSLALAALRGYGGAAVLGAIFTLCYVPLNLATRYLNALNQGIGRFARFNMTRMSVQFTYVAGVVALFLFHIPSTGLVVAVILISNIVALLFASHGLAVHPALGRIDRGLVRQTFIYGVRAYIGNLTPVEGFQLDLAAVFLLLGPYAAGLYAIALSTTLVLGSAGLSLGMVALPSVAGMVTMTERAQALGRWLRLAAIVLIPSSVLIAVAAGPLVPLVYGDSFAGAAPLVRVLAFGALASGLRRLLGDCLRGAGKPTATSAAEVVTLVVALALIAPLIWRYGATGAAAAVSIAYAAGLTASLLFARRVLDVSLKELLLPQAIDARTAVAIMRQMVTLKAPTQSDRT